MKQETVTIKAAAERCKAEGELEQEEYKNGKVFLRMMIDVAGGGQ